MADLDRDENEGEIALAVFGQLRDTMPVPTLEKVLAWIVLHPTAGAVRVDGDEFGLQPTPDESIVRERCAIYARKLLRQLRRDGLAAPTTMTRQTR